MAKEPVYRVWRVLTSGFEFWLAGPGNEVFLFTVDHGV